MDPAIKTRGYPQCAGIFFSLSSEMDRLLSSVHPHTKGETNKKKTKKTKEETDT
jgi:hypothetical protein